jgi:hypothetical protein
METTIDEVQVWDNWNSKHRLGEAGRAFQASHA